MIAALTPFLLVLGPPALVVAMGTVFAETGLLVGFFLGGVPLIAAHVELVAIAIVALSLVPAVAGLIRRRVVGDPLVHTAPEVAA